MIRNSAPGAPYRSAYYQALDGFAGRWERELTILLYHGVTDSASQGIENYSGKHVPVADFQRDMRWISKHCTVLGMDEIAVIINNGDPLPSRAVAVTFDDGFANNHSVAASVLDEYSVPATFYFCAGMVNTDMMFWVDVLEDCINLTRIPSMDVTIDGERQSFDLSSLPAKISALETIKRWCKQVDALTKDDMLDQVIRVTGITPDCSHADNYKKISWKQVRELADHRQFIVGGHSLYHDILTSQTIRREESDIKLCQALLSHALERPITHFSYPEGQQNHYRFETIKALQEVGVVCSPAAICGLNSANELDPFHLKRIMVGFYGIPLPWVDPVLMATSSG